MPDGSTYVIRRLAAGESPEYPEMGLVKSILWIVEEYRRIGFVL